MRLTNVKLTTMRNPAMPVECESRQLISDLFHQLSQPLTTLCCSLELALLQTPTAEQYGEIVSRAHDQVEKASWLATAIRELFDAGQVGEDGEVLELRWAVEDALADLLPVAQSAGVQVCYSPRALCPVWFDAQRLRQGLFHLLGFGVASGGAGAVMKIELDERDVDVLLALTISRQGGFDGASTAEPNHDRPDHRPDHDRADHDRPDHDRPDHDHPPGELARRLGLGIPRAIFEAAGGSLRVEREAHCLRVEVRLLRNGARLSSCAQPDR